MHHCVFKFYVMWKSTAQINRYLAFTVLLIVDACYFFSKNFKLKDSSILCPWKRGRNWSYRAADRRQCKGTVCQVVRHTLLGKVHRLVRKFPTGSDPSGSDRDSTQSWPLFAACCPCTHFPEPQQPVLFYWSLYRAHLCLLLVSIYRPFIHGFG